MLIDTTSSSSSNIIQEHISLHAKTWFKTGGKARFFAQPNNELTLQDSLAFANKYDLDLFILGAGANILISDDGFDGLVINPQLSVIFIEYDTDFAYVTAGSGTMISDLITFCLDHTIIGLEEFSGIPGTVGGAVYINLHYFEFLLAQFLTSARVIHKRTGIIETVDATWFNFSYNKSRLQTDTYYLVDATFKLKRATLLDTAYARGRSTEIIRHRNARYPRTHTCGSFFRNFHDHEVTLISNGKKIIYVAYYLDKIGIKGALSSGDAVVSYQHANMIVNNGNATSTDIITLARMMQEKVMNAFGIIPQPECILVGFKLYPLHR